MFYLCFQLPVNVIHGKRLSKNKNVYIEMMNTLMLFQQRRAKIVWVEELKKTQREETDVT